MWSQAHFLHCQSDESTKKRKKTQLNHHVDNVLCSCIILYNNTFVILTHLLKVWWVWWRASINVCGFGFSLYIVSVFLTMLTRRIALWSTCEEQNINLSFSFFVCLSVKPYKKRYLSATYGVRADVQTILAKWRGSHKLASS